MKDSKQPKLTLEKSIMIQNYEKIILKLNTFKIQCDRKRVRIIPIFPFCIFQLKKKCFSLLIELPPNVFHEVKNRHFKLFLHNPIP